MYYSFVFDRIMNMKSRPHPLPNDVASLKKVIRDLMNEKEAQIACQAAIEKKNEELAIRVHRAEMRAEVLEERLNLALAHRYAARSEKRSLDQLILFNEAEADHQATPLVEEEVPLAVMITGHVRKTPGRKPLPTTLPRVDIVYTLPLADRICPHDGQCLTEIGTEISEQLDIIPAKIQVLRHIRTKYACACGRCIKSAPMPAQPLPKSMASPGLLAHVAVSKYQDALPLYRQEEILQRIGVDIPRATLAAWMIKAGVLIQPLINLMRDRLLGYDILQMDETTVQVLKEPGKTAQSKSYLWVQRGGPPDQPIILFDYDPGRGSAVPVRLLEGFKGYLQTDGYDAYNAVVKAQGLTHAGCLAHSRRKFDEAVKAQGKHKKKGLADEGLHQIQKLYLIEKTVREAIPEERYAYRLAHAQPVWKALRAWLDTHRPQVPPQTAVGKALSYLHNEWEKLLVYLQNGRLEIDNNKTENALRPFCLGRKNWLFSDSVAGVQASANLYSLIETAKACGLEPYDYLRTIFTDLPKAQTVEDLEALLPGAIKPDQIVMVMPVSLPKTKNEDIK